MSKNQNPEISQKLIDALIRSALERGFGPGIGDVAERAGVSKEAALARFPAKAALAIAALERVGGETRRNLEEAANRPDIEGSSSDCDTNRVVDCLARQITDPDNPAGFITLCLMGHPDPRSEVRAAAMREHAAIARWLEDFFSTKDIKPRPQKAADALMALAHGTYANVLGNGLGAWKSVAEADTLMGYVLIACSREKTAVPRTPERKGRRAQKGRKKVPARDPAASQPPGDP